MRHINISIYGIYFNEFGTKMLYANCVDNINNHNILGPVRDTTERLSLEKCGQSEREEGREGGSVPSGRALFRKKLSNKMRKYVNKNTKTKFNVMRLLL